LGFYVVDPFLHVGRTAFGVSSDADESANLGFDNHAS